MSHNYEFRIRENGELRAISYQTLIKTIGLAGETDSRGLDWRQGATVQALALQGLLAEALDIDRMDVAVFFNGSRLF